MTDPALRIHPSLLSCDFAHLADEVAKVEAGGADMLHVDVMDGHFVPNLTIGPVVVAAIARVAERPLDVHLMIEDPWKYRDAFLDAGADVFNFHVEVADRGDAIQLIESVRQHGARAAMTVNPDTPVERLQPFLSRLDMVLVMSVFPGFAGQRFMPEVLPKIPRLREMGFRGDIEVDGGIGPETIAACAEAGANVFVAGSAIFNSPDPAARIAELREIAAASRRGA